MVIHITRPLSIGVRALICLLLCAATTTMAQSGDSSISDFEAPHETEARTFYGHAASDRVMLSWTATGDDDTVGTASFYDLRFATEPITENNWENASQIVDLPTPLPFGSPEAIVVSGFDPGPTYYFCIKAADECLNWSELSPYIAVTIPLTEDQPEDSNDPTLLDQEFDTTEELPTGFALSQNYPNPFNPETQIGFTLAEPSQTSLKIYNLLGQEITSLVDQFLPAGDYTYTWRADNLPTGTYFYRLQTEGTSKTRRMILLK